MGIRASSSTTTSLSRGANMPANTSFTLMMDCLVVSDRGSGAAQPIFLLSDAGLTDVVGLLWEGNGADGLMQVQVSDAGVVTSTASLGSRPAIGSSFVAYLKCSGTGANLVEGGWRYPGSGWVTATATLGGTIAAPTQLLIARISTIFCNLRVQNLKMWDRPLSTPELWRESLSDAPVSNVALNLYAPCSHVGDVFDRSGRFRTLTKNGTLSTEYLDFPRTKAPRKPMVMDVPAVSFAGFTAHNVIFQGGIGR